MSGTDTSLSHHFCSDPELIDVDQVHALLLQHAYWAAGRSRSTQAAAMAGSRNYAILDDSGDVLGYARVVTDGATFGWLADVVVAPAARGRGLARSLVTGILADLEDLGLKRILLRASVDGQTLYEQLGWTPVDAPQSWLQLVRSPTG